jgi:hypothetical protein
MEPTLVYFAALVFAIAIGVSAVALGGGATRQCPQCGGRVAMTARRCRGCQYTFS